MSVEDETKGVIVRFPPELLARVDAWKVSQGQGLSRRASILRLIEYGLGADQEIELRIEAEVQRRLRPLVSERVSVVKGELREALADVLEAAPA